MTKLFSPKVIWDLYSESLFITDTFFTFGNNYNIKNEKNNLLNENKDWTQFLAFSNQ